MALVDLSAMTIQETHEYVEFLENEVKDLRRKTDNRKKLTGREVDMIKRLWDDGNGVRTQAELAEIFNVNPATISRTVRGIYHAP